MRCSHVGVECPALSVQCILQGGAQRDQCGAVCYQVAFMPTSGSAGLHRHWNAGWKERPLNCLTNVDVMS